MHEDLDPIASVPCGKCTLCCQGDAIRMLPGDDVSLYRVVPHEHYHGQLMLDHKPNGDCIYLDRSKGCTIHEKRPRMCREMDCRRIAQVIRSKKRARQMAKDQGLPYGVWQQGRKMLAKFPLDAPVAR